MQIILGQLKNGKHEKIETSISDAEQSGRYTEIVKYRAERIKKIKCEPIKKSNTNQSK